jgi:cardiolipin synthase A/B
VGLDWIERHWPELVGLFGAGMSVAATAHVLLSPRDVRSANGWVALILLSPVVGPILYVLLGINRIQRKAVALRGERNRLLLEAGPPPAAVEDEVARRRPDHAYLGDLARAVTKVTGQPLLDGNAIEPLVDGDQAFPAMLEAIAGARRSITLMTYIFDADRAGRRFIDALVAAQARGVDVRVLIDAAGVRYHRPPAHKVLAARGVRAALFLPLGISFPRYFNLRNHRKVMVVDGELGFTGGMNLRIHHWLGESPRVPTRDVHFRVEGPVVAHLQEVFAEDWEFATRERLRGEPWFVPLVARGDVRARGISEGPDDESDPLPWTVLTALATARERIRVVTPYFLPDPPYLAALNVAALRGVTVDVVLPARSNIPIVDWATRSILWELLEHGVRLWWSPAPFDHAKLMTVDGAWTLLGSANWDARSLRLNFEFDVEAYSDRLAEQVDALIDERLARARPLERTELDGRTFPRRLADGAARLLVPYL